MKTCPNCKAEVEDNFEICWKCQYSFSDSEVLKDDEIKVVCPACNAEVDPKLLFCPYCKHKLDSIDQFDYLNVPESAKQINCLRCQVPMSFNGNFKFHEGTRMGVFGDIFELLENRESFDLYFCPKCGKVEFFLPQLP